MIDCLNQVLAMEITYILKARGFVYLSAVVDWFTRRAFWPGAHHPPMSIRTQGGAVTSPIG